MSTFFPYLIALAASLFLAQAVLTVWLVRALRGVKKYDERLSQLNTALSLLTETTESGFGVMASAIERLGQASPRTIATRTTTARVAKAARRGHSVQEIAAAEEISESEVHLRLHLAEAARGIVPATPSDKVHDSGAPRSARRNANGAVRS